MTVRADMLRALLVRNTGSILMEHRIRTASVEYHHARLTEGTPATKLGAAVLVLGPGKIACPYHLHHAQEEMFVILEGSGTLRIAGEHVPIGAGDVITAPAGPDYPRQIINTSDAQLKYLAISTQDDPEIYEYPDSGKFMAEAGLAREHPFEVIQRSGESLDYWDGEA
jgi:uncharacterized cupin superfamily protein